MGHCKTVKDTQQQQPDPGNGPPNLMFGAVVPLLPFCVSSWDQVYPGTPLAALLLIRDVKEFGAACATCARNKAFHQVPAGLLRPLPVPGRPSSHISKDIVIGLPQSEANTVILTIVDHFSEAAHLVALPKLLSALETANLPTQHAICLHGFALEIASDSGSQFVFHV